MFRHLPRVLSALALLLVTVGGVVSPASAQGTSYYVGPGGSDGNAGTSATAPVATLQHGAGLIGPGDTLWVLEGNYDGFSATVTGSAAAYARIAAFPGATPTITALNGNGAHLHDSTYVEIWGLEFDGDSELTQTPNGAGILVTGTSHHIRLVQNTVHHFGSGGIVTYLSGDHLEIYHNVVYNNANWNPSQHSGISLLGLENDGLATSGGYNNYVVGNLIHTNEVKVTTSQFGGGERVTDGNCFVVDVTLESNYTGRTLFGSNICVNNGGRGTQVYKSADVDVVNNTFYQNMRTPDVAKIGSEVMAYDSQRVRFANNLIMSRNNVLPLTAGASTDVIFANNLTSGTENPRKDPSDRHLGSADGILAAPSIEAASLTASNFTPVSDGPAIDHGSSSFAAGLAVDFAGNARTAGSGPDAGALERGAAPANWPWSQPLTAPAGGTPPPATGAPDPQPEPEPIPAAPQRRDAVGRLYSAAFLRAPDSAGLEYWLGLNAELVDIANQFTISAEFSGRYGSLDDRGFVDRIYRNVLERSPDDAGFDYWTGLMDDGLTRAEVLLYFSDSAEYRG